MGSLASPQSPFERVNGKVNITSTLVLLIALWILDIASLLVLLIALYIYILMDLCIIL